MDGMGWVSRLYSYPLYTSRRAEPEPSVEIPKVTTRDVPRVEIPRLAYARPYLNLVANEPDVRDPARLRNRLNRHILGVVGTSSEKQEIKL